MKEIKVQEAGLPFNNLRDLVKHVADEIRPEVSDSGDMDKAWDKVDEYVDTLVFRQLEMDDAWDFASEEPDDILLKDISGEPRDKKPMTILRMALAEYVVYRAIDIIEMQIN